MDDSIKQLTEYFRRFPGIGPRQARRFVYYLLNQPDSYTLKLAEQIRVLKKEITQCQDCFRFFPLRHNDNNLCPLCISPQRHREQLLVVEKDADLESVEKSGGYQGRYFVLGGLVPILEKEPSKFIRLNELKKRIQTELSRGEFQELILALSANVEADHTVDYLREMFNQELSNQKFKLTVLGRGLSSGLEIEYSDSETIKAALENRH